jgi:hypothetical protein
MRQKTLTYTRAVVVMLEDDCTATDEELIAELEREVVYFDTSPIKDVISDEHINVCSVETDIPDEQCTEG